MKILVYGAAGKMGKAVCEEAFADGHIALPVTRQNQSEVFEDDTLCDLDGIIDFSSPDGAADILAFAERRRIPIVIGTTGHSAEQIAKIKKYSHKIPVLLTANTSKGIGVLKEISRFVYEKFPDCEAEIVEFHHGDKLDSPGGTAKSLAQSLKRVRNGKIICGRRGKKRRAKGEIGIASVRGGNEAGTHKIYFYCGNEIITVEHRVTDRRVFASGALELLKWLKDKKNGFYSDRCEQ